MEHMEYEKTQVLRYLGHRGQDIPSQLDALIEKCICLIHDTIQPSPHHIYRTYDLIFLTERDPEGDPEGISVKNTQLLLTGTAIRHHLSRCHQIVLLAVTLGVAIDNLIRRWEAIDMTQALILDACATQLIEQCCDETEAQIRQDVQSDGLLTTSRFSPGYGDLPLDIQPTLLAALDAEKKIGLTCTQNLILLPRKSVTALIGLKENPLAKASLGSVDVMDGIGLQNPTNSAKCPSPTCENCSLKTRCVYSR